ncbi:MAG: ZIP family metal transporter [Chromatiales bacterium]
MDTLIESLSGLSPIGLGLAGSLIAGLGTGVGALPMFLIPRLTPRIQDVLLAFSAGIMLAATFFSLIQPGLDAAAVVTEHPGLAAGLVILGVLFGAAALWAIHTRVPHEHVVLGRQGPQAPQLHRMWLLVLAITLHNLPEGLAVGVGFGGPDIANAVGLMIGIGLQNMPEGLAVAVALTTIGYSRASAFGVALLTGLVEPVGGLIGVAAVSLAAALLPWGLAFAAGAMLFVISNEIIPETHRRGFEGSVTFALLGGFSLMLFLDQALA